MSAFSVEQVRTGWPRIGKYPKVRKKYWGVNLGQRIKQARKSLHFTDSFITLRLLCQDIGSFGLSRRTKYKLLIKPCNSSSRKQTRFRGNQIHLPSRHLDVLTEKLGRTKQSSAERKIRNQATFGNNRFLFRFICGAKNERWTKGGRGLGPAENWASHCTWWQVISFDTGYFQLLAFF